MMDDSKIAGVARRLADALMRYARERREDDKKHVAQFQTELCAARREELVAAATEEEPA